MQSSQEIEFKVGDKAVYPAQGVAEVISIDEKDIAGARQRFYVLRILDTDRKIMVPVSNANAVGLRQVISEQEIREIFDILRERGLKIGVFSDYPVEEKLIALKLNADATCYSLESGLGKLKPQTLGLETIINRLALNKSECVFIGDRDLRDGICARRLGIPFILRRGRDFYKKIIAEYRYSQVK